MGGGLMQLVAYGAQDVFLTGTPEITFWKVSYRRHTNFAMESIEQTFSGQADFGRRVHAQSAVMVILCYRTYLQVTLPEINQSMGSGAMLSMPAGSISPVSSLSLRLRSRLVVNALTVSMVTGCTSGTSLPCLPSNRRGYNKMIGNTTQLTYITDPTFRRC